MKKGKDMQQAKIIENPYLLWTGGNGHKCFGIKVKALNPNAVPQGFNDEWCINDYTLLSEPKYKDFLGLTDSEHSKLLNDIKALQQ